MDESMFNRNVSRNSSVGCSSRIYYCRSTEGVAFNWEKKPGTPRNPKKEEAIAPLTPPPALISLGLPKPCIDIHQTKPPTRPRLRFWRKTKKNKESRNVTNCSNDGSDNKFDMFDFCTSDSELMASTKTSQRNSSSSSSSSFSLSKGRISRDCSSLRSTSPARDSFSRNSAAPFSCSPWNFSSLLISMARRV